MRTHKHGKLPLLIDRLHVGNPKAQERYAWLSDGFKERFGSTPTLFARAPGEYATSTVGTAALYSFDDGLAVCAMQVESIW